MEKDKTVILYGIGEYYERIKEELFQQIRPDYLCDRKWDVGGPESYHGIPIIKRNELESLGHGLIIITAGVSWIIDSIRSDLEKNAGFTVRHVDEILGVLKNITGRELKEACQEGCYRDTWGNCIYFDSTLPDSIRICFYGKRNTLQIGRNVIVDNLRIYFGNEGTCRIGEATEIVSGSFNVSGAELSIGRDCLLSSGLSMWNHDGHHIFDIGTHKRINYPKDIWIGDHVWIGQLTTLLPGARIGNGSIVGAGSVTSGQFGENQIIAGAPARMIREQVCWSRDNTNYFNHDILEECISQEALKYL